jgi:hypothetical protein
MILSEIELALIKLDIRLDEVKRFGGVLQRTKRMSGACSLHYSNRIQAIEIEHARLLKLQAKLLKDNTKVN